MKTALITLILLLGYSITKGQEKPGMAVEMASSVTYSGISTAVELHFIHSRHNLYIGPKLNLSNSVMPNATLWGISSGYRYILMDKGNVYAAAWGIYENLNLNSINKGSSIHEIYGALASGWRFNDDKISVLAGLGLGGYIEKITNNNLPTTQRSTGGWLRVSASYRLF